MKKYGKYRKEKEYCLLKGMNFSECKNKEQEIEKINHTVKMTLFLMSGYEANMCFKNVFFHSTSVFAGATRLMKGTVHTSFSPTKLFPLTSVVAARTKQPTFIWQH